MLKAGLITGALTVVIVVILAYFEPFSTLCAVTLLGATAGYLAGIFEKPSVNTAATKAGALSGTIGGIGAIIGVAIGRAIFGLLSGPQGARGYWESIGSPITSSDPGVVQFYWIGLITSVLCFSILDILLMAGFGALGGILWWQITGKNANPPASA